MQCVIYSYCMRSKPILWDTVLLWPMQVIAETSLGKIRKPWELELSRVLLNNTIYWYTHTAHTHTAHTQSKKSLQLLCETLQCLFANQKLGAMLANLPSVCSCLHCILNEYDFLKLIICMCCGRIQEEQTASSSVPHGLLTKQITPPTSNNVPELLNNCTWNMFWYSTGTCVFYLYSE